MHDAPTTLPDLRPDCASCAGLCCVALPFTRSADFPVTKAAGDPCRNLRPDDRCAIHTHLRDRGWTGCTVFECYGAGQRITAAILATTGTTWRDDPTTAATTTFAAFPITHQLHEMLWYLTDPAVATTRHTPTATALADEIDALAARTPDEVAAVDVGPVRTRVAMVLRAVSDDVRGRADAAGEATRRLPHAARPGGDLAGARLRRADLRSAPLRGALLIGADLREADLRGADLLGADLRGARLDGADLRGALFLTQPQANAATGDARTRLPERLARASHWG